LTGIFGILSDLGLGILTTRDVARDKLLADKYLGNVTAITSILVVVTLRLIALSVNLAGYPKQTVTVVYFVALSVVFTAFTGVFNSLFQAFEKMETSLLGEF
jgi:O-antigen/teichoic acid export membrane protein